MELRGKVRVGDAAATDVSVVLSEGGLHYQQKSSRSLVWSRRALTLDADGAFAASSVLADSPRTWSSCSAPRP